MLKRCLQRKTKKLFRVAFECEPILLTKKILPTYQDLKKDIQFSFNITYI